MCGGGGGGGGSVNRVSAPAVPQAPRYQGDPAPRTEVKPTPVPVFQDDVIEKPKAPKPPVVAKPTPRPTPLSTLVDKVTSIITPKRPPIEGADQPAARPAPVAKPQPTVRAAPPMPVIPAAEPAAPAPMIPVVSRRPAPV